MTQDERITDGLALQAAVNGDRELARLIAARCSVKVFETSETLMAQGEFSDDIYFILRGRVECLVDGVFVAERNAGQHVGEMAAIDPRAARSADVVASEPTEVAVLAERDLAAIGKEKPRLWRNLAIDLAAREREAGASPAPSVERETRKKHLFYVFLAVFAATAAVTLLGITKVVTVDDFYLKGLFAALLIELVGCVIALFKGTDFF